MFIIYCNIVLYSYSYHSLPNKSKYYIASHKIKTILYSNKNDYSKNIMNNKFDNNKSNKSNKKQTINKTSNDKALIAVRLNKCINGLSRRAADDAISAGIRYIYQ